MGTSKGKRYKCPYCEYRDYRSGLIDHVEENHSEMIPKGYTPSRIIYNTINKKDHGTCMICHKETKWDEDKQRYNTLCENPRCKKEYVKIVRSRMVHKYGTYNLLNDPNFQKKMLENRSISGKYKFQDGGSIGYVGSYEKKFLEFMDQFLHIKSYDIISPGPNIPYMYKGKEHVWITDFLYEPYNLVFDIKDGGDNPNTRDMKEYREKQLAKEKAIAEYGDYNYIRLTDNKFDQLISIFMELKEKVDDKPIIRINEFTLNESCVIEGFAPKFVRINMDLKKDLTEDILIQAAKEASNFTRWCRMDDGIFCNVHEFKNFKVNLEDAVFCFAKYTGGEEALKDIINSCNKNNHFKYGEYEAFSEENLLCGKITELYRYEKVEPMMNESYIEEETRIEYDKLPKFIYHISYINHDGETFEPRVYDNDNVKNGMERRVKRVCFSDSITRALYSIFPNGAYDSDFYVHIPDSECKVYKTTTEDIYDSDITHELWIKEPVKMKCIGKIHVSGVSNKTHTIEVDKDKAGYGKKKYHETRWNWVEKYEEDKTLYEYYITGDSNIINENLILNKKDLEINLDKFESGEKNVLLVTGFSGSGKSTLASQLASKYKCIHYELDCLDFYLCGYMTQKDMIGNEDGLYEFVNKKKLKFKDKSKSGVELYREYIKFLINYCKKQKDKKFIIEGLQIYEVYKEGDTFITSCPMIIKGTSGLVSAIRGAKRNDGSFLKELGPLIMWALKDDKKINNLKKSLNEFVSNKVIKDFESKKDMNLSKFTKMGINVPFIQVYKREYPSLSHIRINGNTKGCVWLDNDKNLVAIINTEKKDDDYVWINSFEIFDKYKGHGLSKQILKYAIKEYGITHLSVNKNNEVAYQLYKNLGFKTYRSSEKMYFMCIKEL